MESARGETRTLPHGWLNRQIVPLFNEPETEPVPDNSGRRDTTCRRDSLSSPLRRTAFTSSVRSRASTEAVCPHCAAQCSAVHLAQRDRTAWEIQSYGALPLNT